MIHDLILDTVPDAVFIRSSRALVRIFDEILALAAAHGHRSPSSLL
jgi:hypothetical protein